MYGNNIFITPYVYGCYLLLFDCMYMCMVVNRGFLYEWLVKSSYDSGKKVKNGNAKRNTAKKWQ